MHFSELPPEKLEELLHTNLEDFGVSPHVAGILDSNGIYDVRGLLNTTKDTLMNIKGLNTKSVNRLFILLRTRGFY